MLRKLLSMDHMRVSSRAADSPSAGAGLRPRRDSGAIGARPHWAVVTREESAGAPPRADLAHLHMRDLSDGVGFGRFAVRA